MEQKEELRIQLHQMVDDFIDKGAELPEKDKPAEDVKPESLKGKRLVFTKSSGDRKYQLDDDKKIRQWVATPAVLDALGWKMEDAIEVSEKELLTYQMGPAIYRVD